MSQDATPALNAAPALDAALDTAPARAAPVLIYQESHTKCGSHSDSTCASSAYRPPSSHPDSPDALSRPPSSASRPPALQSGHLRSCLLNSSPRRCGGENTFELSSQCQIQHPSCSSPPPPPRRSDPGARGVPDPLAGSE